MLHQNLNRFTLRPFEDGDESLEIDTQILLTSECLEVHFFISGDTSDIAWCELQNTPLLKARRDGLWTNNCLELFWSRPNSSQYFELNLSPFLEWNIFEFQSYRSEKNESSLYEVIPLSPWGRVTKPNRGESEILSHFQIRPRQRGLFESPLHVFPTAVIKREDKFSFWAFRHATGKPDFHKRDLFISVRSS